MAKSEPTAANDPMARLCLAGPRPADELCFLSACELPRHYRARSLSPVEVTRAILDRIAAVNPHVNALYYIDAERRWHRGTVAPQWERSMGWR